MKNFQQNLLVALAICLCGLCAYQWYYQTLQRSQVQTLNQLVYQKSVAVRDATNSIATLNHQIAEMDARLTELRGTVKTNETTILDQKEQLTRLQTTNGALTNEIAQYKDAVGTLTNRLADAYSGIEKQNAALKEVAAQRDEFVKKYNDEVKDRNDVVAKYNDLAAQVQKLQGGGKQ
jgi:chromosome segregation ATPase